ncbi:hypothetical protein BH23CYA1_BH23CYA1_05310 [soil metagenome]
MLIALIIVIGLIPAAISLLVGWRCARESPPPVNRHFQQNFLLATDQVATERIRCLSTRTRHPDEHYVDGMGLVIGDITCQLNARSPYIRCAANPSGPCEGCREYEGREYD